MRRYTLFPKISATALNMSRSTYNECPLSGLGEARDYDGHGEGFRMPSGGTKTAQARTRGAAAMVYGDFEFCWVEVMAKPARRWSWRLDAPADVRHRAEQIAVQWDGLITWHSDGIIGGTARNYRPQYVHSPTTAPLR